MLEETKERISSFHFNYAHFFKFPLKILLVGLALTLPFCVKGKRFEVH